jgi:uncharacterized repeat protein (TIGR03833 family)
MHRGSQRPWRGRGGNRGNHGPRQDSGGRRGNDGMTDVPRAHQVIPGAGVSIVLKVDQPTGNEVQGIIDQVLGRGDHPRGIKVRLVDGRVGRVQRMVNEAIARDASAGLSNLGRNGEPIAYNSVSTTAPTSSTSRNHFGDIREDPYDYANASENRSPINLADYIKPAKNKKGKRKGNSTANNQTEEESTEIPTAAPALVVCPICNTFEGDEEAVAFHANTHFD